MKDPAADYQAIFRRTDLTKQIIAEREHAHTLRQVNAARVREAGLFGSKVSGGGLVAGRRR